MKVYNSLSRQAEPFQPSQPPQVTMYVCGLTPYDHAHVGHTRTYVAFDTFKRYLIHEGYRVRHIQNITDVEDKILNRAKETGEDPRKLVERYHREALSLFAQLGILPADIYPAVTAHLKEIIGLIGQLLTKGYAYETSTGIYYSVGKFKGYGKLSGQKQDTIRAGARVEVDETKQHPEDFALWKKTQGELLEFDSPWGRGRPGWHIECSAMALKYAPALDIHGGARDLIFPHHENEIAQSEPVQKPFCRYWMHTGFLTVQGEKMSKSLGNFIILADAIKKFGRNALRLFFLQTHYRSPMDYDEEQIQSAQEGVERIFNSLGLIRERMPKKGRTNQSFQEETRKLISRFYSHMDDDFDTPRALAALFDLIRYTNQHLKEADGNTLQQLEKELAKMLWILGLEEEKTSIASKQEALNGLLKALGEKEQKTAESALKKLIALRETFRKKKDFQKSDEIRKKLRELGIILEDKGDGIRWKVG